MGVFQLLAGRVMLKITLRINKTAISLVTHFSPLLEHCTYICTTSQHGTDFCTTLSLAMAADGRR